MELIFFRKNGINISSKEAMDKQSFVENFLDDAESFAIEMDKGAANPSIEERQSCNQKQKTFN